MNIYRVIYHGEWARITDRRVLVGKRVIQRHVLEERPHMSREKGLNYGEIEVRVHENGAGICFDYI